LKIIRLIEEAIAEEKRIKGGGRAKKIQLILQRIQNGKICGKILINGKRKRYCREERRSNFIILKFKNKSLSFKGQIASFLAITNSSQ